MDLKTALNRVLSYYHDKRTHFTERIFGTMQRNS